MQDSNREHVSEPLGVDVSVAAAVTTVADLDARFKLFSDRTELYKNRTPNDLIVAMLHRWDRTRSAKCCYYYAFRLQ